MQTEGIELIFGVKGLFTVKCVIERIEGGKVKRYGFISTGNFNEATAKVYTDVTLFTSHQQILKDINKIFLISISIIEHIVINTLLYHHITLVFDFIN
jgi:polyphosphate kinase